jgi:NhaP-type Na+/H+ or K+/H+ antiporter
MLLTGIGLLAMALLTRVLSDYPMSVPVVFLVFGWLIYQLPLQLPDPNPLHHKHAAEILTRIIIVVSLTSAGLHIDRRPGWLNWMTGWRLLGITMILSIVGVMLLSMGIMGLAPATALLIGAMLAPTDPVLADDVTVEEPGSGEADDLRFGLTLEAAFNDGFTFPFVFLALTLLHGESLLTWALEDVLLRIGVGAVVGIALGLALAFIVFKVTENSDRKILRKYEGLVGLAIGLLAFSAAELLHGYGFLAVFLAAVAYRWYRHDHEFHEHTAVFIEQIERLLLIFVIVLLGGMIANGVLTALTWQSILLVVLLIFVVRPLTGMMGLIGMDLPRREKLAISFFGIRGAVSFFYLAFALLHGEFQNPDLLLAIVALTVTASIVIHGLSVSPVLDYLDQFREEHTDGERPDGQQRSQQQQPAGAD